PSYTEIYTLSLHDALPICDAFGGVEEVFGMQGAHGGFQKGLGLNYNSVLFVKSARAEFDDRFVRINHAIENRDIEGDEESVRGQDRKSTRLNSSHVAISYA